MIALWTVLTIAAALSFPLTTKAAVVDIDNLIAGTSGGGSNGALGAMIQTFTPGLSGQLTGLDLQIFGKSFGAGGALTKIDIIEVNAGVPVPTSVLGGVTLDFRRPDFLDGFDIIAGAYQFVDLSAANILLGAGQKYGIMVSQPNDSINITYWNHGYAGFSPVGYGGYSAGEGWSYTYYRNTLAMGVHPTLGTLDHGFRTYMQIPAVPLPASGLLLLGALGGIWLTPKRLKQV